MVTYKRFVIIPTAVAVTFETALGKGLPHLETHYPTDPPQEMSRPVAVSTATSMSYSVSSLTWLPK